jgi:DnaJ-class molecular chaperone
VSWLVYGAVAYLVYRAVNEASDPDRKGAKPKKKPPGSAPHEILDVAADADVETIRQAYQDKIRVYHPDKVAGAADELRALANKRSKEINGAYEAMMKAAEKTET